MIAPLDQQLENELARFQTKRIPEITLCPETTLYVIGNGFDLMHGVPSSYRDFAAALGKQNALRFALEHYLNVVDLWADFETALGHFNHGSLLRQENLDAFLDDFGAYSRKASASDFFAAVDAATTPASTIINDLPRRFRMWVESLQCSTEERPLKGLILGGKVLNFNYTEFVEALYGIPHGNICYIHGCRKKVKGRPKEKLILGHKSGVVDEEWEKVQVKTPRFRNRYKQYVFEAAADTAARNLQWYDEETTKNSNDIIRRHLDFFQSLDQITDIVVIGHSLSEVDWLYFDEILKHCNAKRWFIGFHSISDIKRIDLFLDSFHIARKNVRLFRT